MSHSKRALLLLDQLINKLSSRSTKIPRLILFDIDGTLIYSNHAKPENVPIVQATAQIYNNSNIKRNGVKFSGKTDRGIIREILAANEAKYDDSKVNEIMKVYPSIMREAVSLNDETYNPQLNAIKLLQELSKRDDIICGLLTGNIHENIDIKLGNADPSFLKYFMKTTDDNIYIGGFGSDDEDRNNLINYAKERYSKYLGVDINEFNNNTDFIVIGDTPRDIECAHCHDVPVIAVATGHFNMDELKTANPNGLLKDFSDINLAIDLLCNTNFDTKI